MLRKTDGAFCMDEDAVPDDASNQDWQLGLAVQQLVAKALPAVVPYLARSLKCVLAVQVPVAPKHFVVSASQHSDDEHVPLEHFMVALLALSFIPAGHVTSHVFFAVQQFALKVPEVAAAPYLLESLYLSVSHATLIPQHFVVSESQHSVDEHVPPAHFMLALLALSFIPAVHVTSHVFFVVQQFALKSLPAVLPFLLVSLYVAESHEPVVCSHFVVILSQQVLPHVFVAIAPVHLRLVTVVFCL